MKNRNLESRKQRASQWNNNNIFWNKSISGNIKKCFRDFLLHSSQHGVKYIGLEGQTLIERWLWSAVILGCLVTSVFFIWDAISDEDLKPTITAIQSIHYPIYKFKFPAVTICSLNKVHKRRARRFAARLNLTNSASLEQIIEDFRLLSQLIIAEDLEETPQLLRLQIVLDQSNISVVDVMKEVTPQCNDMLKTCMWKGRPSEKCSNYFRIVRSEDGFCCGFNYQLEDPDLYIDTNYKYVTAIESKGARKTGSCGFKMGLSVLIDNQIEEYHATNLASHGVKIYLHDPYTFPKESSSESFIVKPGDQQFYSVFPTVFTASRDMKSIPESNRHCRFMDEGSLETAKVYSFENCLTECRRNLTVHLCGCSPLLYHTVGNESVCKLTDIPCLSRNRGILNSLQLKTEEDSYPWDCMPACEKTIYTIRQSTMLINRSYASNRKSFFVNLTDAGSAIQVYFSDTVGIRYATRRYKDFLDLLASLGGLSSFFLGISVISLIEIFYFFSIRIIFSNGNRRGDADTGTTNTASIKIFKIRG